MTTFTIMRTRGQARPVAHDFHRDRAVTSLRQIRRPGRWAPARAAPRYVGGHDK